MAKKGAIKETVLRRFAESAETGTLPSDASIVYRVSGGAPGERYEEAVVMTVSGDTRVTMMDELKGRPIVSVRDEVGPEAPLEICRILVAASESLTPASEARFAPDSLVGSISVGVGDDVETYYFEVEEDEIGEGKVERAGPTPTAELRLIHERFQTLEQAVLEKGRVANKD